MKKKSIANVVTEEVLNKLTVYDIELRTIQRGEAKRTLSLTYDDWGHVYVDLDKDDMPLAVTLIVNKKSISNRGIDNEKN